MKILPKIHEILLAIRDNRDGHIRAHFQKGVECAQNQQWERALDHLSQVVARKADHFQAHLLLAEILQAQGKYEEALRHYEILKEISPVRYGRFEVSQRHENLKKFLDSSRALRQLSDNLENYARNLNVSAQKMQQIMRKQQVTLERLAEANRNLRRQRTESKGPRPTLPPMPASFPPEPVQGEPASLPPITQEEVEKVNWDHLFNQLLGREEGDEK